MNDVQLAKLLEHLERVEHRKKDQVNQMLNILERFLKLLEVRA